MLEDVAWLARLEEELDRDVLHSASSRCFPPRARVFGRCGAEQFQKQEEQKILWQARSAGNQIRVGDYILAVDGAGVLALRAFAARVSGLGFRVSGSGGCCVRA